MNHPTVKLIVISFLHILLFTTFTQAQFADIHVGQKLTKIEAVMEAYTTQYDIPAMSIGISIEGQPYFIHKGFYKRDTNQAMDEKGACQIASVSKMFTAAIIKALITEGTLDLNGAIVDYLPADYPNKVQKKLTGITIRDVLHHRSGLPRDSKIANSKRKGNDPLVYAYTATDFLTDLKQMRVKSNPKRNFEYSNFGYALLGYIAERASGQNYEALLQKYVVQPFGLKNTSTLVPEPAQRVTPYYKEDKKRETRYFVMGKLTPPSAIFSNTQDLLKLIRTQLNIYQNRNQDHQLYLTQDARPQVGPAYGYGLFSDGKGTYGHGGDIDGYASNYWFAPEKDLAYVFLTSSGGHWVNSFFQSVEAALLEQ